MRVRSVSLILVVLALVAWPVGAAAVAPASGVAGTATTEAGTTGAGAETTGAGAETTGAGAETTGVAAGTDGSAVAASAVAASAGDADPRVRVRVDSTAVSRGDTYETGTDVELTVRAAVAEDQLAGSNVSEVVVMVDGETRATRSTRGPTVVEEFDLKLLHGEHAVRVIVTDDAGNAESFRFTIRRDADPPVLFLTAPYETAPWHPIPDGTVAGRNVTIAGKIVEDSDVQRVQIRHQYGDYGRTYVFRDAQKNFSLSLELGYSREDNRTNEFDVTAVDEFGNVKSYEFSIDATDGADPTVSFRPVPDETTRNRVFVAGTVGDDVWIDHANVTLRRPDGSTSGFYALYRPRSYDFSIDRRSASFNESLYLVRPGVYRATVSVTDVAGNTTTRTVTVRRLERDLDPTPTVEIDRERTVVLGPERLFLSGVSHEGITRRLTVETRKAGTGETIDYQMVHSGENRSEVSFDREVEVFDGRTAVIVRATDPTGQEVVNRFYVDGSTRETFVGNASNGSDESDGGTGESGNGTGESGNGTGESGSESGDNGGSGNETGADESGGNGTADRGPVVEVDPLVDDRPGTSSSSVSVRRASGGTTVAIPPTDGQENVTGTPVFGVEELSVTVTDNTSFTATVSARDRTAGSLPRPPNATVAGTVTIRHSVAGANVSDVGLTLRVRRVYLQKHGIDPDGLAVYRLSGGNWSRLATERTRLGPFDAFYRADSPGLSVFALATEPTANVTDGDGRSGNETVGNGTDGGSTVGNGSDWNPQFGGDGNGTAPNGTAPDGTAPNGTAGNATAPNGTAGDTSAPNGTAGNTSAPNGTAGNTSAPNGTAPNGTVGNATTQNGTGPATNETTGGSGGEPQIVVVETTVNRTEVEVNESVQVNATLRNSGSATGTYVAGFQTFKGLNRTFVGKKSVTVPAGERRNVSFVTAFQRTGNHTVSVNGTQGGPVTVESGGGGGLLSSVPFLSVFSFLPIDLIGMAIGGLVGLYIVLVLVRFVLRRVGGGGESAGG